MNIAEAKEYIKNTVNLYLKKDEFGDYKIPVVKQRPIFLLGAPGIGKTAIMEQVASELGIALVSYSMTHHTRQSALGLPFIEKREYGGKSYDVSLYTMSEIIASLYETMEESGVKEGILFLDEINCVSETLYPSMLQFLQYKIFGRNQVPEGWVIVTAGNPPEYNRSVREFDVVTLDRLKVLNIEADYLAWKAYATEKGLHNTILSFLDIKKQYFYKIETTVDGKAYVTARGWEDLSEIIYLYEEDNLKVTESLIGQYIRSDEVVREFAAYYDLYNKYKKSYRVNELLEGNIEASVVEKAANAPLDEKLSLVGLLIDKVTDELKEIMDEADMLSEIMPALRAIKESGNEKDGLKKQIEARNIIIEKKLKAGTLTTLEKRKNKRIIALFEAMLEDGLALYNSNVSLLRERTLTAKTHVDNMFLFVSKAFNDDSNEMLVAVTELTLNTASARFFATFGSESYEKYNALLMVGDRKEDLRKEILDLL